MHFPLLRQFFGELAVSIFIRLTRLGRLDSKCVRTVDSFVCATVRREGFVLGQNMSLVSRLLVLQRLLAGRILPLHRRAVRG